MITTIGLDADDTLWHNENVFRLTQERFRGLLAGIADPDVLDERLAEIEHRNLRLYGYGVKGFTLSMIETAMELTGNEAPGRVIADILAAGREMLSHPVETLPGVREVLAELSADYRLVLITKGDLFHQEQKLAASGLGNFFAAVEIVTEKDASTYQRVFDRVGTGPEQAVMDGRKSPMKHWSRSRWTACSPVTSSASGSTRAMRFAGTKSVRTSKPGARR